MRGTGVRRTTALLVAAAIGIGGFATGCGDDTADYCGKLPDYFRAIGESMKGDLKDPHRLDDWAAKAKEMAEIAPDELQSHWDFVVDYSGRMAKSPTKLKLAPGDVKKNGAAGNAIMKHAKEECDLGKGLPPS